MSVRLVCKACGKRLKLPEGGTDRKRVAKCPKCGARVDLGAALEASAYLPTVAIPGLSAAVTAATSAPAKPQAAEPKPRTAPPAPPTQSASSAPTTDSRKPALMGEDDPLPYPTPTGRLTPPLAETNEETNATRAEDATPSSQTEALSLDDDPAPEGAPEPEPPFRVPVLVLADSLREIVGPCFAVLVPHGLFLEHEPMKPFLYVPIGSHAESPAAGELLVTLPDRRAVTFRFRGRSQRKLARDTRSFLAGQRAVPLAVDYRRKWWMLWAALIFALGLAGGPLALSQIANLGWEFGLQVGASFALVGLVANALVVLFSRWSVPAQLVLMAVVCALVTGEFLFGATAYLAGRRRAVEEANQNTANNNGEQNPGAPNPGGGPNPGAPGGGPNPPVPGGPGAPIPHAPTHIDLALAKRVSTIDDGPADVTALALAPDKNTLGIGHADGTTRLCLLDQPTFDAMQPGPKADGPVTHVLFDSGSRFVFSVTATGAVATSRSGPFVTVAKIPGAPVAVAPELAGDRIRFAAIRGNTIQHRLLPTAFITKPPIRGAGGSYVLSGATDEVNPAGKAPDPPKPGGGAGPTFLAWASNGRLFAGQGDGSISIWSNQFRPEAPSRDHKSAVRACADSPATGDFATGDDQGTVAVWPSKGGKPTVAPVLRGSIVALAFSPAGTSLAVADNTGRLAIWDVADGLVRRSVKRPAPVKVMAFGPNDDVLILGTGKAVEVWHLPELMK